MPKVNPWGLSRPVLYEEEQTFRDPAQPDHPLTLRLRQLGGPEQLALSDQAQRYLEAHIDGRPGPDGRRRPPAPFNAPGGGYVPMSRSLIHAAVTLEAMQVPDNPADRYTFADIVGLAVMYPNAWREVVQFVSRVENGGTLPDPLGPPTEETGSVPWDSQPMPPSPADNGTPDSSGISLFASRLNLTRVESSSEPLPE